MKVYTRVGGWVALALIAGLAAGGCSSDGEPTDDASTPSTSAASSSDPDAAEKKAVLTAYRAMTDAEARTYASAKLDPKLEQYAAHKALADITETLLWHQQQGTVMKGKVTRSPKVTALSVDRTPLKATIVDCADSSRYDEVDAETGKVVPVTGDGPRRHVVTSTAERSKTGEWRIYTYVIDRERTC